ncbi:MAG TPA: hydroxysqualene dehydroxylase HpnE [Bryobacteraceae bacterium]|nr:hydroxysqualene dehydroxylase HpnE [Bryobacteraceae bacterium]
MSEVIVIGGGLAGLAAAAALGGAGHSVRLFESRPFPGGRATSYEIGTGGETERIDNCQHILLRCCHNLLDFYQRLGVERNITFHREFTFLEPGGASSVLKAGALPAPAHFTESFLKLTFLNFSEKIAVSRALLTINRESRRTDLDRISMLDWLREKKQPERAIERFWRQILVSAINEELDRMAAAHGLQVFRLGFLARSDAYHMGIPGVTLGELYSSEIWKRFGNVRLHLRTPVARVVTESNVVRGVVASGADGAERHTADFYISALPFERITAAIPELPVDVSPFEHSPITGIHLWFDRAVTDLPHATLLDRTIQWMFNKREGRYLQLVVSASRSLVEMPRADVIALALRELAEFFPAVREARLEKAHVVKEVRATFSARPGLEAHRPFAKTPVANLFLAGDWTRSGWPATMEGAVRSGYLAAEAVAEASGRGQSFLIPD